MKITDIFAVLKPDLSVDTVPVSPTIYDELDRNYDNFKSHVLIASHRFESDWGVWERHPAGDEVVVLLSGRVRMVLRKDSGDESVELAEPGAYVVVPRNTWHTAYIDEPTSMLFVTPGEGTENQTDPDR